MLKEQGLLADDAEEGEAEIEENGNEEDNPEVEEANGTENHEEEPIEGEVPQKKLNVGEPSNEEPA